MPCSRRSLRMHHHQPHPAAARLAVLKLDIDPQNPCALQPCHQLHHRPAENATPLLRATKQSLPPSLTVGVTSVAIPSSLVLVLTTRPSHLPLSCHPHSCSAWQQCMRKRQYSNTLFPTPGNTLGNLAIETKKLARMRNQLPTLFSLFSYLQSPQLVKLLSTDCHNRKG